MFKALYRLIIIERVYIICTSILMINIGFLIVMFARDEYFKKIQTVYETIVISVSPIFWIGNMLLVVFFLRMGKFFLKNMQADNAKQAFIAKFLFLFVGGMQIYSIIADEFIVLFVSGYIFEDIELVAKDLPIIDFIMTGFNEQLTPLNAFFVTAIINYFARVVNDKEMDKDSQEQAAKDEQMNMNVTDSEVYDINKEIE